MFSLIAESMQIMQEWLVSRIIRIKFTQSMYKNGVKEK